MLAKLFDIKETKDKGSGLFAREFIPKGTVVCFECGNCKKRKAEDLEKLSGKELKWVLNHEYIDKSGMLSDVCDKTILALNHSCNSNILFCNKGFDIVVRDIKEGEEATYDYRMFHETDLNMPCNCGEDNCCKIVKCDRPDEFKLFWEEKINSALKIANLIDQPLEKEIRLDLGITLRAEPQSTP